MMKQILGFIAFIVFVTYFVYMLSSLTNLPATKLFDTTIIKKYPNKNNTAQAIIQYDNSGLSTVPFYNVVLEIITGNKDDVYTSLIWSSQHKDPPTIKWIDNYHIEITQMNKKILEYTPTVSFDKKLYNIRLNFLPYKKN